MDRPGGLELHVNRRQEMSQAVVNFAGQPVSLLDHRELLDLDRQRFGAVPGRFFPHCHPGENRDESEGGKELNRPANELADAVEPALDRQDHPVQDGNPDRRGRGVEDGDRRSFQRKHAQKHLGVEAAGPEDREEKAALYAQVESSRLPTQVNAKIDVIDHPQ